MNDSGALSHVEGTHAGRETDRLPARIHLRALRTRLFNNFQARGDGQGPPRSFDIVQDTQFGGVDCGLENLRKLPPDSLDRRVDSSYRPLGYEDRGETAYSNTLRRR